MCLPPSPGNQCTFFNAASHLFTKLELTQVFHFSYTQSTSSITLSIQIPSLAEIKHRGIPFAYPKPLSSCLCIHLTAFALNLSSTLSHLFATMTSPLPSSSTFYTTIMSYFINASIESITRIPICEYFKLLSTSSSTILSILVFA